MNEFQLDDPVPISGDVQTSRRAASMDCHVGLPIRERRAMFGVS